MADTGSPPPLDRHFVALNAHAYHSPKAVLAAVNAVAAALAVFRAERPDTVEAAVFHSAPEPLPPDVRQAIRRAGLQLVEWPQPGIGSIPNGVILNRQVDHARDAGATLFYRADADDLVAPARLVRQAAMMAATGADVSGGALIYVCGDQGRIVSPPSCPATVDVLFNRAALHPALCLRIAALDRAGLRYWPHRLEDKFLIAQAMLAGLAIRNDTAVYGCYNHGAASRSGPRFAMLNLWLNLSLILRRGPLALFPVALILFLASSLLPSQWLRRLRDGRGMRGNAPMGRSRIGPVPHQAGKAW